MRILLADDQDGVRSAIRLLLEQEPGLEVVAEAVDSTDTLQAASQEAPDLLLLDWELPGLHPSRLLRLLRSECPDLCVVAMSSRPEARQAAQMAEVEAFVEKSSPAEVLLAALYQARGDSGVQ